jgi:hypothetical protein
MENMRRFWDADCRQPGEEEFRRLIRGILRQGRRSGELRPDVDENMAASLLEAAYMTTMVEWLRDDTSRREIKATLNAKFDVIFRGLQPAGVDTTGGLE